MLLLIVVAFAACISVLPNVFSPLVASARILRYRVFKTLLGNNIGTRERKIQEIIGIDSKIVWVFK